MRAVLAWSGLSAVILLAALFLHALPDDSKGRWLTAMLFIVTGLMMVKVCRGSR